ncbi:hypothetical protein TIFTF001_021724 [Ficus carica]|uniref:Uncharacterized protein n=1 Tax=Ficus carica TaxID=3494 RepID=A0AA88AKW8_FICCA|nr:hypothetical protein TIFTF001_021724 [Ficus carica]
MASAEQLVLDLSNPDLRENALLELSKKRELFQDLAPLLWNSFGTIAALLQVLDYFQSFEMIALTYKAAYVLCETSDVSLVSFYRLYEIVSIYPVLSPPNLTPAQSNRVCNALALLQCVASHPDTRMLFINGSKSRPFEYLRLTSLGVIGALVKLLDAHTHIQIRFASLFNQNARICAVNTVSNLTTLHLVDESQVINFLLSTEIIPLCLRTMEMGSELSKTVATFIVQKILLDDTGLDYICTTAERFFAVGRVLGSMVAAQAEQPSSRLLKHIIRCYLRLSDNSKACDALRSCLPEMLRDSTFSNCLHEDPTTRRWLQQLLINVGVNRVPTLQGGGFDHMMVN